MEPNTKGWQEARLARDPLTKDESFRDEYVVLA